jgi:hypothetical protein
MSFLNKITLQYNKSIFVDTFDNQTLNEEDVNLFELEINQYGFTFSNELKEALTKAKDPKKMYQVISDYCIDAKGANKKFNPLFKDFPNTKYDDEDYKIQYLHYLESFFGITPKDIKEKLDKINPDISSYLFNNDYKERINHKRIFEALDEDCQMIEISTADKEDSVIIFKNLLSSTVSISKDDLKNIKKLIIDYDYKNHIPEDIPFKENVVVVAQALLESNVPLSTIKNLLKTPTDVLRFTCSLCGGDVSLSEKTKFKLKRSQRRLVMDLLNNTNLNDEDFLRHKNTWIRLSHQLHVGEFANKFPNVYTKIKCLRNEPYKLYSFNRNLEKAFQEKDGSKAITLLKERKGIFFRNILRLSHITDNNKLLNEIPNVLQEVKLANLYSLKQHLNSDVKERFFFLKNGTLWKKNSPNKRNLSFEKSLVQLLNNEINERLSKKDSLGKVYLNPELKNKVAPMNQRFSSKSLNNLPRGSRKKLDPSKEYLRFFTYWENNDSRVDLDLSASGLDEDFNNILDISYYNLKDLGGQHSGDITDAPEGAAEFIDLSKEKLKERKVRYILLNVYSYTGQAFNTFEARAGFMERKDPFKGKTFDAKTVTDVFELNSNSQNATMVVFDLYENEAIFVDMNGKFTYINANNITRSEANLEFGLNLLRLKPNVYDVLLDHVNNRGQLVQEKKDADVIINDISNEDFLSNYLK